VTAKSKELLKNLALLCTTLLLCFLALEVVLKVIEARRPGTGKTLQEALEESERVMPDPGTHKHSVKGLVRPSDAPGVIFGLKPGLEALFKGVQVRINGHGYRDRERTLEKPAGTWRIAALGDSVTFGWGVPQGQVFTNRMEQRLNQREDGHRYEVLNFGVPSYNTGQEVADFEAHGLAFDPDVVLIILVDNDFSISNFVDAPNRKDGSGLATFRFLRGKTERVRKAYGGVGRAIHELARLRELTEPRGIPVIGIHYVSKVTPEQKHHPRKPMDADLRQAFSDNGFIYLDYYQEMRQRLRRRKEEDSTLYWVIKGKDGHPNIEGHDIIARMFLRGMRLSGILQDQWMEERPGSTERASCVTMTELP
jgi:lysophospholipase L1-like esterase